MVPGANEGDSVSQFLTGYTTPSFASVTLDDQQPTRAYPGPTNLPNTHDTADWKVNCNCAPYSPRCQQGARHVVPSVCYAVSNAFKLSPTVHLHQGKIRSVVSLPCQAGHVYHGYEANCKFIGEPIITRPLVKDACS